MVGFTFGVNAVSERLALAGHRSCNWQWPVALTSGDQREMFSSRSTRASLLVDQFCCSVSRHPKRAKQQLALQDAVDLDLPQREFPGHHGVTQPFVRFVQFGANLVAIIPANASKPSKSTL
jgi:hypothetical protein